MTANERAAVAHDLNNIIGVIAGYAELIHERASDESVREYAATLLRAAQRGDLLTRQLLGRAAALDLD